MAFKNNLLETPKTSSKITQLGPIPEGAILATLDVTSRYTNIPNHEGLLAVAEHATRPHQGTNW